MARFYCGTSRRIPLLNHRILISTAMAPLALQTSFSFAANFGTEAGGDTGYDSRYDLDGDGEVGFSDFLIFAKNFGTTVGG